MLATPAVLAGQARAGGSQTAAQDQYTPKQVVKPPKAQGPATKAASAPAAPASSSTLPFTGLSLLKVVLVGVVLVALGFLLRRGVPRRGP
jgi:hypothetical protein